MQDPSCRAYSQALLYFKGFHSIQVGKGEGLRLRQQPSGPAYSPLYVLPFTAPACAPCLPEESMGLV